ncbi:mitochondrial division protein 1 [Yarrowia lipolytica]|uniref:Mitochondrial division protein 1 n=1 Tax=Yarrowia lipolytica TaxID=4952 RepID=A0A371C279_YARLL|nr:mitochondrial division protein 1 [Yarrowia lipolytica]RDW29363.1 mitochondrial division protein 1 [Yarrowia lipolytica]RDW37389.1 mitochondrial division protein 1 [Yarrowia lipolytica]RDW45317.1 mitochondrial division protein 1 [Yarrowia lipolytica]RDW52774.1 mitochondrial division protein 1 [Yarrowia lipolytica]
MFTYQILQTPTPTFPLHTAMSDVTHFSKVVAATASTLVSGDLSQSHVMRDISRPAFQKRIFSFSKRPSELVRITSSSKDVLLPDEMLVDIPSNENQFSLFQGFQATLPEHSVGSQLLLGDGSKVGEKSAREQLVEGKKSLSHKLDLLEVRKALAANEITEIDARVAHLQSMRQIVFDRVASLEQQEFQLESEVLRIDAELEQMEEEKEEVIQRHDYETRTPEELEDDVVDLKSVSEKLQSASQKTLPRRNLSRRKTQPTLQQYYEPGNKIRQIEAHSDSVTCLDFDIPFGTMVSAGMDLGLKVWDLSRGDLVTDLKGHNASVTCLQVDNNVLATGSADATIRVWNLDQVVSNPDAQDEGDDAYTIHVLDSHVGEISAIHFSDHTLVSGSADKTIRQWDLNTGRCVQTLDVIWANSAQNALYSNDRLRTGFDANAPFIGAVQCRDAALATGTADGIVRLWDLRSGQVQRTLQGHTAAVTCLQFDDVHLATGSRDRSVRIWDLRMGNIFDAFAYDSPITSLDFDNRRIASTNGENTVKIYDRAAEKHWSLGRGEGDPEAPESTVVKTKEGYLVEGGGDGVVGVWAC